MLEIHEKSPERKTPKAEVARSNRVGSAKFSVLCSKRHYGAIAPGGRAGHAGVVALAT